LKKKKSPQKNRKPNQVAPTVVQELTYVTTMDTINQEAVNAGSSHSRRCTHPKHPGTSLSRLLFTFTCNSCVL